MSPDLQLKQSLAELDHVELTSKTTGEKFSLSAILTDVFGFQDLFVHHEIVPPGRKSSAPHAHSHREELVYVLAGSVTAHCGRQTHELRNGDFVGFKPNQRDTHYVENRSDEEAQLLIIASNPKEDVVIYGEKT